jgi:hypothetical protein
MPEQTRYCEAHEVHWIAWDGMPLNQICPWCQRDKLFDELELIKEVFEAAAASRESKGGQQVPYFGDFASVSPSTLGQMRYWVDRWKKILPEEYEP